VGFSLSNPWLQTDGNGRSARKPLSNKRGLRTCKQFGPVRRWLSFRNSLSSACRRSLGTKQSLLFVLPHSLNRAAAWEGGTLRPERHVSKVIRFWTSKWTGLFWGEFMAGVVPLSHLISGKNPHIANRRFPIMNLGRFEQSVCNWPGQCPAICLYNLLEIALWSKYDAICTGDALKVTWDEDEANWDWVIWVIEFSKQQILNP
jgi:hypothetical protein